MVWGKVFIVSVPVMFAILVDLLDIDVVKLCRLLCSVGDRVTSDFNPLSDS